VAGPRFEEDQRPRRAGRRRIPAGVVDVRVTGAAADTEVMAALLAEAAETVSGPRRRANRDGPGQRIYITLRVTAP
jgi:hypothetical protein